MKHLSSISPLSMGATVLLLVGFFSGCAGARSETGAEKPAVAVEVATATRGRLSESLEVVGTLKPKFEAAVKAEYPGTVAEVFVTEWVRVSKGQPLARLDDREAVAAFKAAEAEALRARAGAERALREYDRAVKLQEAGLMTRQGVDDAKTMQLAADASLEAALAQRDVAEARRQKSVIRSPLDGAVAMRAVSPGDLASGDPIFQVVDDRILDLTVTVPASQIHRVKVGQTLSFTVDAVPGIDFQGVVSQLNPAVDASSRTVRMVAEVDNHAGTLRAGYFAKGTLLTSSRDEVLQVPEAALREWDPASGSAFVFAVSGDRAQRTRVRTGTASGSAVEIVEGLEPGSSVVTRGGFLLKDGDRLSIIDGAGV